ncbi:MAG: RnfABCDGE type electron transport complex subunit A [Clostridia bacterium]|nr:RnfABCDGE type electron transport complex subunit A [Clostridia bacterium]
MRIGFILVSVILVDNFVLSKFLGICPFLGVSKKFSSAIGMSGAVTFVMALSAAATWPIYHFLLAPNDLGYLRTLTFILIIAMLVQIVEILLKRFIPALYSALGVYLPLITTNCAVLGVTLLNITEDYSFIESVVNAAGGGIGFGIALIMFSGVREKLETCNLPKAFRGMPAVLIAASIVSLSFAGFAGLAEGIFGSIGG